MHAACVWRLHTLLKLATRWVRRSVNVPVPVHSSCDSVCLDLIGSVLHGTAMPAFQARKECNMHKTRRDHVPLQQTCRMVPWTAIVFCAQLAATPVDMVVCWRVLVM